MSLHTDIDVSSKVTLFSKLDEDQTINLKASMNYYFQVQGQIAILNLPWCAVVWMQKDTHYIISFIS